MQILLETGHFENNEHEAIIWLNTLGDLESERAGVIDFLKKSLIKVVRNPHPFNDKVADAVAKAHMLRENEGDIHTEIASIADAGIAGKEACHSQLYMCPIIELTHGYLVGLLGCETQSRAR